MRLVFMTSFDRKEVIWFFSPSVWRHWLCMLNIMFFFFIVVMNDVDEFFFFSRFWIGWFDDVIVVNYFFSISFANFLPVCLSGELQIPFDSSFRFLLLFFLHFFFLLQWNFMLCKKKIIIETEKKRRIMVSMM